ncbi:MAG: glycosyltransferase family 4 protein [Chloroflexi bacterium]|nr:glycosyltransferase family 4 protein [Chloroflexota bacterium]
MSDITGVTGLSRPKRVLFVFSWLVVGGEETEVRLLAQNLDSARYKIEVVACFRKPNMPDQTHIQLESLGVPVDRTPYDLSFEDTVEYLSRKLPAYDVIVACQAVPDVYPALARLAHGRRPPLIEHGGLVGEALAGPKHFTSRYVGVCDTIRRAAASAMPDRPQHALEIPSMVDLAEFDQLHREPARRELGVEDSMPLVGWVGRLDRKKRVEDFVRAAAAVCKTHPEARFVIVGGPDAFMPEYAGELARLGANLGLEGRLLFLGDRPDVPRLLSGLDIFVWLAQGEGMPHVIAEAGAAHLPVIATRDNGTEEQIEDEVSGLFVPHESPEAVASAINRLIDEPGLRHKLGAKLRLKVEREYSAAVVARRWEALFDEIVAEAASGSPTTSAFKSKSGAHDS